MDFLTMELKEQERVYVVTMNYKKENRFNPAMIAEMMECLDIIEKDDRAGAVVFTGGDPKFFSNGLDLEHIMMNIASPDKIVDYLKQVNGMFKRVTLYPKPTVAALNGHTFAAGLFLAAHMDFRFMREDRGWICAPEIDINIPFLPGMIEICRAVMPPASFHRLYYTGGRFTGPEALNMGFVEAVYPEDQLIPKSVEFAAALAKKKMKTYAEMKRRIREEVVAALDEKDPQHFMGTLKFSMPG